MSVHANAAGESISHGNGAAIDDLPSGANGFTVMIWANPVAFANLGTYAAKGAPGGPGTGWRLLLSGTGGAFIFGIERETTDASCTTSTTISSAAWNCIGATYEDGKTGNDAQMYFGTLTAAITEAGYSANDDGLGAIRADAGLNLYVGNLDFGTDFDFPADAHIGQIQVFSKRLSVAEMISQQFRPHMTAETVLFTRYHGTGFLTDISGNGFNGTNDSCTSEDSVPLASLWASDEPVPYATACRSGRRTSPSGRANAPIQPERSSSSTTNTATI